MHDSLTQNIYRRLAYEFINPDYIAQDAISNVHFMLFFAYRDRSVASRFELENDKVDYILAIMSQPFDFKKNW